MPAYNAERFIHTTVESCLRQATPAHEVILSDDGSADRTREILESFRGVARVRVALPERHLGIGGHYRHLIGAATGTHVVCVSCDDALHPAFTQLAARELARRPDLGLLAFGGFTCDEAMRPVSRFGLGYPRQLLLPPDGFHHFSGGCGYIMSAALWNLDVVRALPVLPEEAGLTTDWYWALMTGVRAPIRLSRRPAVYYRMHDANASHSNQERWRQHAARLIDFLANPDVLPAAQREALAAMRQRLQTDAGAGEGGGDPRAGGWTDWRSAARRILARWAYSHPSYLR